MKKKISIGEHINKYTKLLANLANVKVDEDKTFIILSSLLDEDRKTFVLTLIIGNKSLSYNEVSITLVNHKLRKKINRFSLAHQQCVSRKRISSNH